MKYCPEATVAIHQIAECGWCCKRTATSSSTPPEQRKHSGTLARLASQWPERLFNARATSSCTPRQASRYGISFLWAESPAGPVPIFAFKTTATSFSTILTAGHSGAAARRYPAEPPGFSSHPTTTHRSRFRPARSPFQRASCSPATRTTPESWISGEQLLPFSPEETRSIRIRRSTPTPSRSASINPKIRAQTWPARLPSRRP